MFLLRNAYFIMSLLTIQTGSFYAQGGDLQGGWIDLPDLAKTSISLGPLPPELSRHLEVYHNIPKDQLEVVDQRIQALKEIASFKELNLNHGLTQSFLDNLISIAHKKRVYLENIKSLYTQKAPLEKLMKGPEKSSLTPLYLVNQVMYDLKLPTYWGLFQLEVIDPCHRLSLTEHYLNWQQSGLKVPFFFWLEKQSLSFRELQIYYFTTEELFQKEVAIVDGKMVVAKTREEITLMDQDAEYIYIIDTNFKIFVTQAKDNVRHTSLSHGRPVYGAGSIVIENGVLKHVDAESGHYFPTPNILLQTLKILSDMGSKIENTSLTVSYYDSMEKKTEPYDSFIRKFQVQEIQRQSEFKEIAI